MGFLQTMIAGAIDNAKLIAAIIKTAAINTAKICAQFNVFCGKKPAVHAIKLHKTTLFLT
jgi:hypothetical protein